MQFERPAQAGLFHFALWELTIFLSSNSAATRWTRPSFCGYRINACISGRLVENARCPAFAFCGAVPESVLLRARSRWRM